MSTYFDLQAMKEMLHVPFVRTRHVKPLVDGGNVQDNELVYVYDVGESNHHDSPASHTMSRQAHNLQVQFLHQTGDIGGHQTVIHLLHMRAVTMVARINSYNSSPCNR